MQSYRFKINSTRIEITDVGGQRSELVKIVDYLRNWSFSASDTRSNFILLVVSMSDFVSHTKMYNFLLICYRMWNTMNSMERYWMK